VRRLGFTLIEMMGVILIIAVLMALLLPALYKSLVIAKQTTARTEIGQLESAVNSCQSYFGQSYIPSQIKLCKWSVDYNPASQLDIDSKNFLLRLFPKLTTNSGQATAPASFGAWATDSSGNPYPSGATPTSSNQSGVNWTQDNSFLGVTTRPPMGGPSFTLEGHQCLVFFLGGIQVPVTNASGTVTSFVCTGFSTNPLNPSDTTSTVSRNPPFFDFPDGRLVQFIPTNPFASFKDAVGDNPQPYAYFSSYGNTNGYNKYASNLFIIPDNFSLVVTTTPTRWVGLPSATAPCIQPYASNISVDLSTGLLKAWTFYKPNSFQILCAGKDSKWGLPPVDLTGASAIPPALNPQAPGLTISSYFVSNPSTPPPLAIPSIYANGPTVVNLGTSMSPNFVSSGPYGFWLPNGSNTTNEGGDDLSNFTSGQMKTGQ
jgi:general secretion pathway protein G